MLQGAGFWYFMLFKLFISLEEMTHDERSLIKELEKCDFGEIHAMHVAKVEARRNMSKEEKLVCFFKHFSDKFYDVFY